jgi:hypothetical protein
MSGAWGFPSIYIWKWTLISSRVGFGVLFYIHLKNVLGLFFLQQLWLLFPTPFSRGMWGVLISPCHCCWFIWPFCWMWACDYWKSRYVHVIMLFIGEKKGSMYIAMYIVRTKVGERQMLMLNWSLKNSVLNGNNI